MPPTNPFLQEQIPPPPHHQPHCYQFLMFMCYVVYGLFSFYFSMIKQKPVGNLCKFLEKASSMFQLFDKLKI